jgi:hypothetical protein
MAEDFQTMADCAMKAARTAHEDFKVLYTTLEGSMPVALWAAGAALDKLSINLGALAGSTTTLTSGLTRHVFQTRVSDDVQFSHAIVDDMNALAERLRLMTPWESSQPVMSMDENECRNIAEMIDHYDRTIFHILISHNSCVCQSNYTPMVY